VFVLPVTENKQVQAVARCPALSLEFKQEDDTISPMRSSPAKGGGEKERQGQTERQRQRQRRRDQDRERQRGHIPGDLHKVHRQRTDNTRMWYSLKRLDT